MAVRRVVQMSMVRFAFAFNIKISMGLLDLFLDLRCRRVNEEQHTFDV